MYQQPIIGNPNAIESYLTEDCKVAVNKLISELDLFATIFTFESKQSQLWQGEPHAAEYVRGLKNLSCKKIRKLLMELTSPLSSLSPTIMKCVMEDVYQKCAMKWNSWKPIEYLRSILFIEERLGVCFAEIQRKSFMETRGFYPPPNVSIQQTQNSATSMAHRPILNATSSSLVSQSNFSYQTPQQTLPSAPLRPPIDSNQLSDSIQNNLQPLYQKVLQQPQQQSIPVIYTPPLHNNSLRHIKQVPSTAPMSTTQSQMTSSFPQVYSTASMSMTRTLSTHPQSVSNEKSAGDTVSTNVSMQFRINQSLQNTIVSNSSNPSAMSIQRVQNTASAKNTFPPQALIDLTPNTPPATPISTDLPILDSSDVADVLNEIPRKKARLEKALETTSNCVGSREKSPADDCLLKGAITSRIRARVDERNTQTTHSVTENQTQNAPERLFVSEAVPANDFNEKLNDSKLANETYSKNANSTVIDAKPVQAIPPIAPAANENSTTAQESEDNEDYVILIETFTECKPKIEIIEKVEIVEEDQVIDGAPNDEVNGTGQSNNDSPKNLLDYEQNNKWYDDISSDSDTNALVIDM